MLNLVTREKCPSFYIEKKTKKKQKKKGMVSNIDYFIKNLDNLRKN